MNIQKVERDIECLAEDAYVTYMYAEDLQFQKTEEHAPGSAWIKVRLKDQKEELVRLRNELQSIAFFQKMYNSEPWHVRLRNRRVRSFSPAPSQYKLDMVERNIARIEDIITTSLKHAGR